MEEKAGGKRLIKDTDPTKKLPLIIAGAVAAAVAAGYLGLCAFAGRDAVWPGTSVMGVDVSGLSRTQAVETLKTQLPGVLSAKTVTLEEPAGGLSYDFPGTMVELGDLEAVVDRTEESKGGFLTRGARYLAALTSPGERGGGNYLLSDDGLALTEEGEQYFRAAMDDIAAHTGAQRKQTTWRVTGDALEFRKGVTGKAVDEEGARRGLANGFGGFAPERQSVSILESAPDELDLAAVREKVFTSASAAYLDRETHEIVPSVTGRDFDMEEVRAALEATGEGKLCRFPLTLDVPDPTTDQLNELLFRDVLGEATTRVTGTSVRIGNVGVAAAFVDGTILFPGEEFSFNKVCSPYTEDNGYGKATAYVNGLSKDTVAGGICQASSTLYWATLMADLETVERYAHRYEPSYIRGGLDATVYGDYVDEDSLDFRFINSTDYPIRIQTEMSGKTYLKVTIYGTNTTGLHGEPYSTNRVITKAYDTIYEANASVPQGTTRKDSERTGYNGVSIETYQRLVDAEGKVVEEELLYKTKYYSRNEVIFFNPADIWLWNIDPLTGLRLETPPAEGETGGETGTEAGSETGGEIGAEAGGETGTEAGTGQEGVPSQQPAVTEPPAPAGESPVLPPESTGEEVLLPPGTIISAP